MFEHIDPSTNVKTNKKKQQQQQYTHEQPLWVMTTCILLGICVFTVCVPLFRI